MTMNPPRTSADKASEFVRTSRHIGLHRFMRHAWAAVEGASYKDNWHTACVAEHLEAVTFGQIKRLLIIVPPQTTKSVLAGTYWPAWEWTFRPQSRWLYTSNSAQLAEVESLRCRRLIESAWYREEFGIPWGLRDDKNTQSYYQNTADGSRQAVGYNANFTGLKASRIVVDDPNDADKVHSETERRRVNRKFDNAISDRLIDLENDPVVIIGQRVHVNDLIGHVREQGGWTELHIRELFEVKKRTTYAVPFTYRGRKYSTDPRTVEGHMLRPKGLGKRSIQQRKKTNPRNFAAKHQGDPRSEAGNKFKLSWFNNRWRFADDHQHIELVSGEDVYKVLPLGALNVRERFGICDPAASKKTSADYTVISTFLITQRYDLVFLGMARDRWEMPEQPKRLADEYARWRMQWVGVEAVFSNRFLAQAGHRTNMAVRTLDPGGRDKLSHSYSAQVYAEAGRLWLPEPSAARMIGFPLHDALDEITAFTGDENEDEHDDVCLVGDTQIQTATGAKPIRSVGVGESVLTRAGYRRVTASRMTAANAKVKTVTLSDGRTLTGTAAHRVHVAGRGFVRIDSLRYGDRITTCQNNESGPKQRPGTESSTVGIRTRRSSTTAVTFSGERELASATFTGTCGNIITGRYQPGARSTTRTAIRPTTTLAIWLASPSPNTGVLTPSGEAGQHRPCGRTSIGFVLSLRLGTDRQKGRHGIAGTPSKRLPSGSSSSWCAGGARPISNPRFPAPNCVVGDALPPSGERPGLMTKTESVPNADQHFASTGTPNLAPVPVRVLSVSDGGRADVFNLTVEGEHEYFANGILTHNCDTISYAADHMNSGDTGGQAGAAPSFIGPTPTNAWQFAPPSKPAAAVPTVHPPTGPTGGAWRRPKG